MLSGDASCWYRSTDKDVSDPYCKLCSYARKPPPPLHPSWTCWCTPFMSFCYDDLILQPHRSYVGICAKAAQGAALSIRSNKCQWIMWTLRKAVYQHLESCSGFIFQFGVLVLSCWVSLMGPCWLEFTYLSVLLPSPTQPPTLSLSIIPSLTPALCLALSLRLSGHLQDGVIRDEDARGWVHAREEDG